MDNSVTQWISGLRAGESQAIEALWERFFQHLVNLARRKLGDVPRRVADEEDVAIGAFKSLCGGAARGAFPALANRENLWAILVTLTIRKVSDQIQHECRARRGGGNVACETDLEQFGPAVLPSILAREPTPEMVAILAEEFQARLDSLGPETRNFAEHKLNGYTNHEIAAILDCGLRTVERKLALIRLLWGDDEMSAD